MSVSAGGARGGGGGMGRKQKRMGDSHNSPS